MTQNISPNSISDSKSNEKFSPFMEIPASLVQKLLNDTDKITDDLILPFLDIQHRKQEFRSQLFNKQLIRNDSEMKCDRFYSTCGVDGSCGIDRLVGTDLIVAGAVGVEGLSQSDNSLWDNNNYDSFVSTETHDLEKNDIIARALMLEMELKLAANAPYDLILMDGSLTTALIHMYKAVHYFKYGFKQSVTKLRNEFENFLASYKRVLAGEISDRIWIGLPKYTSRNDIGGSLNLNIAYDDKALLSLVLAPGEFTSPTIFTDRDAWHVEVPYENERTRALKEEVTKTVKQLSFIYYKPHSWTPALRIEVPYKIVQDEEKLFAILQAIKTECKLPTLLEPYPLYMADRQVKNLSQTIPSLRQIATRRMVEEEKLNAEDIFFMMRSYRTESGRS